MAADADEEFRALRRSSRFIQAFRPKQNSDTGVENMPSAHRFTAVNLLAALVLLILSAPFVEDLPQGDLVQAALLGLVMLFAVLAAAARRSTLIIALALMIFTFIAKTFNHFRPDLVPPAVFLSAAVIFFGFVTAQLLRFIFQAPRVDANVLCAGVAGFLLLGLLWVPLYWLVSRTNPGAFAISTRAGANANFEGFDAFYFSFITLCTVGYGDVTPLSKVARVLAITEAITGMFYMALLVARLVSAYSSADKPSSGPPISRQ
jgi:voltage-gated potassium channel